MREFREIKENTDSTMGSVFELDLSAKEKLLKTMHGEGLAGIKNNNWEKIIVAGELSLLNIDVKTELSDLERESFNQELISLRKKIREDGNDLDYLSLARCVYRFKNIGLDFESLTKEEADNIKKLPKLFRNNNELHGHLNYLPQIASSLNDNIENISELNDLILAREAIENDLKANKNNKKELEIMVFSGLLVETNKEEAKKLIEGEFWPKGRWNDVADMLNNLKKSNKNNSGYLLARLLPQFLKMNEFIKSQKN